MRIISLLVLVALVGGAAYVLVFKRDWLWQKVEEGKNLAEGYTAAKTPSEAMEQFRKAVKDRNYKAAALYCSGDYAEQLTRAHDAARGVGGSIDRLKNLMDDKGLTTPNGRAILYYLDPFPPNLKVQDVKKKGDDKALGAFTLEEPVPPPPQFGTAQLNPLWFTNCLSPSFAVVEVARVGSSDDAQWKLNFPLPPARRAAIDYFMDHHRSLSTGLGTLRDEANRDTFLKGTFEPRLKDVLQKSQ